MIVFGTHVYPAKGEAAVQQEQALETWRKIPYSRLVNLQFADKWTVLNVDGFATSPTLQQDSNQLCQRTGIRKPVVKEMLTRLEAEADAVNARYFGLINADIILAPEIASTIESSNRTAVMFSRRELDPDGPKEICTRGVDAVFFRSDWWKEHQHRIRPYVIGEAFWDIIVTSIALAHGDGLLINNGSLVQHIRHPIIWNNSPFRYHNEYLAALDRPYFSRFLEYHRALNVAREKGTTPEDELALQKQHFKSPIPLGESLVHLVRCAWRFARYSFQKRNSNSCAGVPKPGELMQKQGSVLRMTQRAASHESE